MLQQTIQFIWVIRKKRILYNSLLNIVKESVDINADMRFKKAY